MTNFGAVREVAEKFCGGSGCDGNSSGTTGCSLTRSVSMTRTIKGLCRSLPAAKPTGAPLAPEDDVLPLVVVVVVALVVVVVPALVAVVVAPVDFKHW